MTGIKKGKKHTKNCKHLFKKIMFEFPLFKVAMLLL